MDIAGVNLVFGDHIKAGHTVFVWNADGSLNRKYVYSDNSTNHLMYDQEYHWNADGTLNHWILTVATTGEVVTKYFQWSSNGFLVNTNVISNGSCL